MGDSDVVVETNNTIVMVVKRKNKILIVYVV